MTDIAADVKLAAQVQPHGRQGMKNKKGLVFRLQALGPATWTTRYILMSQLLRCQSFINIDFKLFFAIF